jgi:effector-binding domain-containing protein
LLFTIKLAIHCKRHFILKEVNLRKTISVLGLALLLVSVAAWAALNSQEKTAEKEFVSLKEVSPFSYCCITHKGPFTEIEGIVTQLLHAVQEQKIMPTGPIIGVYYNSPEKVKPEELVWEMGFPIAAEVEVKAPLEKKEWKFTLVASAIHKGPYEESIKTLNKMFEWMKANNLKPAGPLLERYLTMPGPETKPEDLRAEIWHACQKVEK